MISSRLTNGEVFAEKWALSTLKALNTAHFCYLQYKSTITPILLLHRISNAESIVVGQTLLSTMRNISVWNVYVSIFFN